MPSNKSLKAMTKTEEQGVSAFIWQAGEHLHRGSSVFWVAYIY